MKLSKVLFVGLGGAGQRHLRVLRELLPRDTVYSAYRRTGATPFLRPDFTPDPAKSVESAYDLQMFDTIEAAFADGPDLTVVSTPTSSHREPMMMAMEAGSGILVEKPWAESLDGFEEFSCGMISRNLRFMISFQRRFHPLIARARAAFKSGAIGRPVAATMEVWSYVPAWHPYENWRESYAVRPELGGGVLLTEIHEIDLAHWFFGVPKAVFCVGGNFGAERLEVEDTIQMTLLYEDFSVQINLCFMHSNASRGFHIAGTEGDISWTSIGNRLAITRFGAERDEIAEPDFTNDAMFIAQAGKFVSAWSPEDSRESLAAAGVSQSIVGAARRSMVSGNAERVTRQQ